ncbi:MAG TPA: FMN-binding negative transcriptional regulator [Puia sp.]|jgi:transcriptional regulator|nr:FMN-binding negative transcriptional regulator [Puia sp.]
MYIPRRYEEKDLETIHAFIRENSFAILVSVMDGRPVGTHIPLLLERDEQGRDVLVGHISRGNVQKASFVAAAGEGEGGKENGVKVLAIFPGPHAYVSPRWYTQINVPTWNYMAVHVYGTLTMMEGEELRAALSRLVDNYERHLAKPVDMEEIGEQRVTAEMRGIVGFRIVVDEIQAAYKLSQNRDERSYHEVIRQLGDGDEAAKAVAAEMERRGGAVFSSEKGAEK